MGYSKLSEVLKVNSTLTKLDLKGKRDAKNKKWKETKQNSKKGNWTDNGDMRLYNGNIHVGGGNCTGSIDFSRCVPQITLNYNGDFSVGSAYSCTGSIDFDKSTPKLRLEYHGPINIDPSDLRMGDSSNLQHGHVSLDGCVSVEEDRS